MSAPAEVGIRLQLDEVVGRVAGLVGVGEEIGYVAGPGGEVGVVGVRAWAWIGALDEVSGEDFGVVREDF